MILNGIGNDIYSTVDACPNAKEMWVVIGRLQQGESINIQDVKTKLFGGIGKFTLRDRESVKSYYTRLYRMMNEIVRNKLKVDTMQVNVKNANPLALVATTQHYPDTYHQAPEAPKPYKTHAPSSGQTTSTRLHANTKNKGKEIVKAPLPPFESTSNKDNDKEQSQRDKSSLNTMNKNVDTSPRIRNDRQTGQFRNQRTITVVGKREIKRVKDYVYHKEKMLLCKKEVACIQLSAKHSEWLQDTYDEPDKQELEEHYMYMTNIQEVLTVTYDNSRHTYDTELLEKVDSNVIPDSSDVIPRQSENTRSSIVGSVPLLLPSKKREERRKRIAIGQRFSPKKSSAVHEKPNTPRSFLRWKPTGRIFKIAGLRWIPTGKMFTDNTTKVDSEPPNGSNGDITNPYECYKTLNVNTVQASLFNEKMTSIHISSSIALQRHMTSADNTSGPVPQSKERCTLQCALSLEEEKSSSPVHSNPGPAPNLLMPGPISLGLVPNPAPVIPYVPPTNKELELLFQPIFDEYFTLPAEQSFEVNPFSAADPEPFVNMFAPDSNSEASSSMLATDALWCFYNSVLSKVEPKNFNSAVIEDCWFQAMQDEIHEFDRLDVWELVPPPNCAMIIALKWIYKIKLDEYGDVLKNKAHLVAKGYRQEEGLDFE
ncbi:retrovirus-related pol polyprotein from transposon TNT 1-94 [Tanacetum coccineum]